MQEGKECKERERRTDRKVRKRVISNEGKKRKRGERRLGMKEEKKITHTK